MNYILLLLHSILRSFLPLHLTCAGGRDAPCHRNMYKCKEGSGGSRQLLWLQFQPLPGAGVIATVAALPPGSEPFHLPLQHLSPVFPPSHSFCSPACPSPSPPPSLYPCSMTASSIHTAAWGTEHSLRPAQSCSLHGAGLGPCSMH